MTLRKRKVSAKIDSKVIGVSFCFDLQCSVIVCFQEIFIHHHRGKWNGQGNSRGEGERLTD